MLVKHHTENPDAAAHKIEEPSTSLTLSTPQHQNVTTNPQHQMKPSTYVSLGPFYLASGAHSTFQRDAVIGFTPYLDPSYPDFLQIPPGIEPLPRASSTSFTPGMTLGNAVRTTEYFAFNIWVDTGSPSFNYISWQWYISNIDSLLNPPKHSTYIAVCSLKQTYNNWTAI